MRTAPLPARGSPAAARGGKPCGGSRQSTTRACRGALPAPPRLLLRTVADPCIEAGVPDDRRGAGMDCSCRQPTERAGAHGWPELARCMSGASAPRLYSRVKKSPIKSKRKAECSGNTLHDHHGWYTGIKVYNTSVPMVMWRSDRAGRSSREPGSRKNAGRLLQSSVPRRCERALPLRLSQRGALPRGGAPPAGGRGLVTNRKTTRLNLGRRRAPGSSRAPALHQASAPESGRRWRRTPA